MLDKIYNFFFKSYFGPIKDKSIPAPKGFYNGSHSTNSAYGVGTGGEKYPYGLQGHGYNVAWDHFTLRMRSRRAMQDTPTARGIVSRMTDSSIDKGLYLRPEPITSILKISEEQAEDWAEDVSQRFHLWANSKESVRDGSMNFYQLQRFLFSNQWRDGEYFVRFYYSKNENLQNPLNLQVIDPNQILPDTYTSGFGDNPTSNHGIIKYKNGRPKAYKILLNNALNGFKNKTIEVPAKLGNRIFMAHGFSPEFPGQDRGFPLLSHVLQEFSNLTDFSLSHIKKAIIQSMFGFYTKPSKDAPASNPLIDLSVPAGGVNSFDGANASEGADEHSSIGFQPLTESQFNFPGAMGLFTLQGGEDFKAIEQNTPMQSYDRFVDSFVSNLSASVSIPVEVLNMKFNSNFSASRAALLMFWRVCNVWRMEFASDILKPVYESWLYGEIASGKIKAVGLQDPTLKAAWFNSTWIGTSPPNIDPQKTAKADMFYTEMGAKTLDQVAREQSNSSGRANRSKLKKEFENLPKPPWTQNPDIENNNDDSEDE